MSSDHPLADPTKLRAMADRVFACDNIWPGDLFDMLNVAAWRIESAESKLEAADRAADERWCKALEAADWDGGVFHYDGRIYPWPRGFVPDCPATWEEKARPLQEKLESAEARIAELAAERDAYSREIDHCREVAECASGDALFERVSQMRMERDALAKRLDEVGIALQHLDRIYAAEHDEFERPAWLRSALAYTEDPSQ